MKLRLTERNPPRPWRRPSRAWRRPGFTLIELLVVMAISICLAR